MGRREVGSTRQGHIWRDPSYRRALEQAVCASIPGWQVRPEERPGDSGTLAAGEGGARRHKVPQPPTRNTPKAGPALTPFLSRNLPSLPLETKLTSTFPSLLQL